MRQRGHKAITAASGPDTSFAGRVAVITGAGSGIGRSLALDLGRRGATVVAVDIAEEDLARTTAAVIEQGGAAWAHPADVSVSEDMWRLADEVRSRHGGADIIVNNAAIAGEFKPLLEQALTHGIAAGDNVRRITEVNLLGVVNGTLAFLPQLADRPEAFIVNVSSEAGIVPYPACAPYSMTKFGVRGFTEALQMELRGSNVTAIAIYPGATKTNIMMNSPLIPDSIKKALHTSLAASRFAMSSDAAAEKIVAAILQGKFRVLLHPATVACSLISRLAPVGYQRLLAPVMKQTQKIVDKAESA